MKDTRVFVDTNILVYAYDLSAGDKHDKAKEIIKNLWSTGEGLISTQVLPRTLFHPVILALL